MIEYRGTLIIKNKLSQTKTTVSKGDYSLISLKNNNVSNYNCQILANYDRLNVIMTST